MRPVTQRILGKGWEASQAGEEPGDCLRAAVASIFEKDLDDVPHFAATGPEHASNQHVWAYALSGYVAEQGAFLYTLQIDVSLLAEGQPLPLPGYSILTGLSPRANGDERLRHSVVGWNGVVAWDPHPSRCGIETIDEAEQIVPTTSAARVLLATPPGAELMEGVRA